MITTQNKKEWKVDDNCYYEAKEFIIIGAYSMGFEIMNHGNTARAFVDQPIAITKETTKITKLFKLKMSYLMESTPYLKFNSEIDEYCIQTWEEICKLTILGQRNEAIKKENELFKFIDKIVAKYLEIISVQINGIQLIDKSK